jgi:hypothetical protein
MTAKTEHRENVAIRGSVMRKLRRHVFSNFDGKMRGHITAEIEAAVLTHIEAERPARSSGNSVSWSGDRRWKRCGGTREGRG